jgi:hypothetical protein
MKAGPVQDAKARFSEFLDACLSHGRTWSPSAVRATVADFALFRVSLFNPFEASPG